MATKWLQCCKFGQKYSVLCNSSFAQFSMHKKEQLMTAVGDQP